MLIGGYSACDSIYYIFKYTFKQQESIDSRAAATLAQFIRIEQQQKSSELSEISDEQLARRRIAALAITSTNKQEIALPLCAYYIRKESSANFSHGFVNLYLAQYIKILTEDHYETLLTEQHGI
jgi:hypothetical protein